LTCLNCNRYLALEGPCEANLVQKFDYFGRFFGRYTFRMTQSTWPEVLATLLAGENLSREGSSWAMRQIMAGEATEGQIGAFMMALRSKGETVEELSGLVDVMLENALLLETGSDAVDIVGTGGDLVGTVNISSMASIVAAASGIPVLKHGSRSASGKTGSSEMLEVLGIRLDLSPTQVKEVFEAAGITFFFAPVFHPAMRFVAPVRKQLGVPTTFNFLGPLANPAQPVATALGVSDEKIAPLMAEELAQRRRSALVFRSKDGLDELSTTSTAQIWQVSDGEVSTHELDPQDLGLDRAEISQLLGGDAKQNAMVASKLFAGETFGNSQQIADVVALNAAAGIVAYELSKDSELANSDLTERFQKALVRAQAALESGDAKAKLESWTSASQQAG
jgi:anthranilate phosphoribosyltransferase